ncbi:MAG: hypothetical protein N2257_07845 [Thermodesulfovibrionales bacterium]|nr:hypothetical protein [Thermodesulfovibrionales bacterium]
MRLDLDFSQGHRNKPAIVFIHGLGMDKTIWSSPCDARIAGGLLPFSLLIREKPETFSFSELPLIKPESITAGSPSVEFRTPYHDLKEEGYSVITWSQRRPVGPIDFAVKELSHVIQFASLLTDRGIILIGHSRGGLIARKYIELENHRKILGLLTIATPHRGSTMAEWVRYFSAVTSAIIPLFKNLPEGRVSRAIKRIVDFLKSDAIKELLPDSPFIKSLKPLRNVRIFSLAGTSPRLFTIYRWKLIKEDNAFIMRPEEVFSYPHSLISLIPEKHIPPEWKEGSGDGLVSLDSARFEICCEFSVNHAKILTDQYAREYVRRVVREIS